MLWGALWEPRERLEPEGSSIGSAAETPKNQSILICGEVFGEAASNRVDVVVRFVAK